MRCERCGRELGGDGRCAFCGGEQGVRVMAPDEAASYRGVTIEEDADGRERPSFSARRRGNGVYVRSFRLGNAAQGGWLVRLAAFLGAAALLGFLLFVALPAFLFAVGIGIAVWLVLKLLRPS